MSTVVTLCYMYRVYMNLRIFREQSDLEPRVLYIRLLIIQREVRRIRL